MSRLLNAGSASAWALGAAELEGATGAPDVPLDRASSPHEPWGRLRAEVTDEHVDVAFRARALQLGFWLGWLAIVAIKPILQLVPVPGILLIVAGGVAYTSGLAFFAAQRLRYSHFIWHLFVIAGTTCHFFAVLWYAA